MPPTATTATTDPAPNPRAPECTYPRLVATLALVRDERRFTRGFLRIHEREVGALFQEADRHVVTHVVGLTGFRVDKDVDRVSLRVNDMLAGGNVYAEAFAIVQAAGFLPVQPRANRPRGWV